MTPGWRFSLVAAFVVASCHRADSASGDDSTRTDSSAARAGDDAISSPVARSTCGVDEGTTLTGDGVGDLRIATSIDQVIRGCRVVRDTVVRGAEGMQERRVAIDLGRDTVIAVVDSNRVWRLHVQRPAFRTPDSLGVASLVSTLRRPGARLLTGEGAYFVTLPSHCGLSFRVRGVEFGRVRTVDQIPDGATVGEVLVVGCRRGSG